MSCFRGDGYFNGDALLDAPASESFGMSESAFRGFLSLP